MDNSKDGFSWFEYAENDFEAVAILSTQLKPKHEYPNLLEIEGYHMKKTIENATIIREFVLKVKN